MSSTDARSATTWSATSCRAPARARSPAYGGDPGLDRWRLAVTYRRLTRRFPPRNARVFEIGFGAGALLRRFLDGGAIVSGADPGALKVTVDPVVATRATLHTTSLEHVPLQDPFDLVFAVHVIEHVADPTQFARACHDLVRPGGQLVLVTPAGDSRELPCLPQPMVDARGPDPRPVLQRALDRPAACRCRLRRRPGATAGARQPRR